MKILSQFLMLSAAIVLLFASCDKEDEQKAIDEALIQEYLAENPNTEFTKHNSGIYYTITKEGNGPSPNIRSVVTVRYKGYLLNGEVFDQTDIGRTFSSSLSGLIKGWQHGIPLLKTGGTGTFIIPSHLGYGSSATGSIPANSVLLFDIDLLSYQ